MQDVMLDLETMGNGATAAIVVVGAVAFDPKTGELGAEFSQQVDLQSSIDAGLTLDGDTVMWWLGQSDEARAGVRGNDLTDSIHYVLDDFGAFAAQVYHREGLRVWGCGAGFDNAILANAYRACGLKAPWEFWNDRCYRTVKAMRPDIKMRRVGMHHNALDDAKSQARHLAAIYAGGYA